MFWFALLSERDRFPRKVNMWVSIKSSRHSLIHDGRLVGNRKAKPLSRNAWRSATYVLKNYRRHQHKSPNAMTHFFFNLLFSFFIVPYVCKFLSRIPISHTHMLCSPSMRFLISYCMLSSKFAKSCRHSTLIIR